MTALATRVRLGVNVDHVATLRNARGGTRPDPVRAAKLAIAAGADGITAHIREDRRHIRDADIQRIRQDVQAPLNFEMAASVEMAAIAMRVRPHACCLVPERREELTTEGGLDAAGAEATLTPIVARLAHAGIRVSLFIDAEERQIEAAVRLGAPVIELHTGRYAEALLDLNHGASAAEYERLEKAAAHASAAGLEVHAGHGLDFDTAAQVAAIPYVAELNIGHFLVGEAVFIGLREAVMRMRSAIDNGRATGLTANAAGVNGELPR